MDFVDKKLQTLDFKGLQGQRAGRVSRTYPGKEYAIIYDYIHDHAVFLSQFHNPKKENFRLKAYLQCTEVHEELEGMIEYMRHVIYGARIQNKAAFERFLKVKDDFVIDIDEIEENI